MEMEDFEEKFYKIYEISIKLNKYLEYLEIFLNYIIKTPLSYYNYFKNKYFGMTREEWLKDNMEADIRAPFLSPLTKRH